MSAVMTLESVDFASAMQEQQPASPSLQPLPPPPPSSVVAGFSLCVGCGGAITDPYILRVQPDLEWHANCLKCVECSAELNQSRTCYVRNGKPYCKADYCRLFASRCAHCEVAFSRTELVMRVRSKAYHVDCFRCCACARQLLPGEQFALRSGRLFCRADFAVAAAGRELGIPNDGDPEMDDSVDRKLIGRNNNNNNNNSISNNKDINEFELDSGDCQENNEDSRSPSVNSETPSNSECSVYNSGPGGGHGGGGGGGGKRKGGGMGGGGAHKDNKATRVRTVLNEKQLHTLRTCYAANPRPDALMKEQLVEMTGLSPRVIRVWFQNKRCKDKKKQLLVKQMENQQQKRSLNGVPMIASSPVRHDPGAQPPPLPPPPPPHWAQPIDPHSTVPPFQQLVSAYSSLYCSDEEEEDDSCVTLPTVSGAGCGLYTSR